jgi:sarcosine oxidase
MYDAIVIGTGGVGSAAAYHLARRGAKVLGLDRFPPAHDRGSSHGETRIIRQAYFEHPDYVPLVLGAYDLWAELAQQQAEQLYYEVGLVQIGPPDGIVLPGVLESARQHGLSVEMLSASDIARRFPGFHADEAWQGVLEQRAGYLRVEACVLAHLAQAVQYGAELKSGITVRSWLPDGSGVRVETDAGEFKAARLIISAGPWASQLLADLKIPLVVRRAAQYWFAADAPEYAADKGCPTFLFETPEGIFYGFPRIDELGVKTARHAGGPVVTDPLAVDREVDVNDERLVETFLTKHLPDVSRRRTHHAACMYTLTPDEHFIVDRHPAYPQVVFAAGLSGHGFKFTCVLGEALADLALDGQTRLPIGFLSCNRPALHTAAR